MIEKSTKKSTSWHFFVERLGLRQDKTENIHEELI